MFKGWIGLFCIGKSDWTWINFTSSIFRPTFLQNTLEFNIVALITRVLEHLSNMALQKEEISRGFNSTSSSSSYSFFILDTIQFFGFERIASIICVNFSVSNNAWYSISLLLISFAKY